MEERPFAKVDFYPRESMKYHSKIDPTILLGKARIELGEKTPEVFKILLLAIGAGLRRGEIDRLLWRQINLDSGEIHIEVTEAGSLKSADSTAKVAIDETLCGLLRGYKAKATSQFVIEGGTGEGGSRAWGQRYQDALSQHLQRSEDGRLQLTFEVVYGHAFKPRPRIKQGEASAISLDEMRAMLRTKRAGE